MAYSPWDQDSQYSSRSTFWLLTRIAECKPAVKTLLTKIVDIPRAYSHPKFLVYTEYVTGFIQWDAYMSYAIEKLDEHIILINHTPDFDLFTDVDLVAVDAIKLLDSQSEPVYFILDLSAVNASLESVTVGIAKASLGENKLFHHPKIKQVVCVSTDEFLQLAFKGLSSAVYGHINVAVFSTVHEALTHARSHS